MAAAEDDAEGIVSIYGQSKPAWCEISFTTADGDTTTGVILASFYDILEDAGKPFCFWELRRVLGLLGYARADGFHKRVKELMQSFRELCTHYGHFFNDHFHYSLKAGRSLGIDLSTCTPEYELSTFLFQAFILHTTVHARGNRRSRAEKLLEKWLSAVLATQADAEKVDLNIDEDYLPLCQIAAVDGKCAHVSEQISHLRVISAPVLHATPQCKIASMMRNMFPRIRDCRACSHWMEALITMITEIVDENGIDLAQFKTNFGGRR